MNLTGWQRLFCLFLAIGGCASQPIPQADPFAAMEALDVRFLHKPPPNAQFIAKIPYSNGSYGDDWQRDCIAYLRTQAVKLGGNVVIPATELDWGSHHVYNDVMIHPNSHFRGYSKPAGTPATQLVPAKLHFWSNIYYCPDYD